MRSFSLAFLLGILLLQNFSYLPNKSWVGVIIITAIAIKLSSKKLWKILYLPIAFSLGFAWCIGFVYFQTAWALEKNMEGKNVTIIGYVASIPDHSKKITAFLFSLKEIQFENK